MSIVNPGGSGDVPEIDDGLYMATVKAVKDIVLEQPDSFGNTEKVEIQIYFQDIAGVGHTLEPRPNRKWGEKATLYAIAQACGLDVSPHEAFDTEELVGCKVNVLIETAEEGKWPRVKSWTRIRTSKTTAPKAPLMAPAKVTEVAGPILNPDGTLNAQSFWIATRKINLTRDQVIAAFGGDVDNVINSEPIDVATWLEEATEAYALAKA